MKRQYLKMNRELRIHRTTSGNLMRVDPIECTVSEAMANGLFDNVRGTMEWSASTLDTREEVHTHGGRVCITVMEPWEIESFKYEQEQTSYEIDMSPDY